MQEQNERDFNNEHVYYLDQTNTFYEDISNKVRSIREHGDLNLDDENNEENYHGYSFTREGIENINALFFDVFFNYLKIENQNFIKLNFETDENNDANLIRQILRRLKQMLVNNLHLHIDFIETIDNNDQIVNLDDIQNPSTCQMAITI